MHAEEFRAHRSLYSLAFEKLDQQRIRSEHTVFSNPGYMSLDVHLQRGHAFAGVSHENFFFF